MSKILLVEDNAELSEIILSYLKNLHYTVDHIANGKDASGHLRIFPYDVIILDWELPELSGIEISRAYRSRGGNAPILMLTGRGELTDKEAGFGAGVDDYLTKPFQLPELGMRVNALLKRARAVLDKTYTAGPIELDPVRMRVTLTGTPISLLKKEFALLEFLMRHPGHVFNYEAILERVWESDSEATREAVKTVVKRLRKKIDPEGIYIKTHHGIGYSLETDGEQPGTNDEH